MSVQSGDVVLTVVDCDLFEVCKHSAAKFGISWPVTPSDLGVKWDIYDQKRLPSHLSPAKHFSTVRGPAGLTKNLRFPALDSCEASVSSPAPLTQSENYHSVRDGSLSVEKPLCILDRTEQSEVSHQAFLSCITQGESVLRMPSRGSQLYI